MALFTYDPAILERYPSVVGGAVVASGLTSGPSSPELLGVFSAEQRHVLERLGTSPLSEIPSLAAWRRAFRAFGVDPTAYRSAAEALLRRLTKAGSIPSINALVDIGNLVSIRYGLPVAMFDAGALSGGITVRFADGTESFTDLASGEPETPDAGEVIFVDDGGLVAARRWCWRQSRECASGAGTTAVLVTIEGHHDAAAKDVANAVQDLRALLSRFTAPASVADGMVTAGSPAFDG